MQEFAKVLLAKKASGGKFTKVFYSTLNSIIHMYRIIDRKNYSSQHLQQHSVTNSIGRII